jgi:hypothetical protein
MLAICSTILTTNAAPLAQSYSCLLILGVAMCEVLAGFVTRPTDPCLGDRALVQHLGLQGLLQSARLHRLHVESPTDGGHPSDF